MKKLLIALLLLTAACHKKDVPLDPSLDMATWLYCQYVLDKEATLERMVGTWKLVGSSCGECSDVSIRKAEDNVRIVISQGTDRPHIVYFKNDVQEKESNFDLEETTRKNAFLLETAKHFLNPNTAGIVEVCQKDRLAFRNAPIEHFFVRVN